MSSTLSSLSFTTSTGTAQPTFTPGLKPPPGVRPDPDAYNDLRTWMVFTVVLSVTITGILLLTRCFIRAYIVRRWGLQDFLCIFSWSLFLALTGVSLYSLSNGAGQHQYDLDPEQVTKLTRLNYINQLVYNFAALSVKITLLYLYQCIFAPARFSQRWWFINAVMLSNLLFYLGLTFAKAFLCTPRAAYWDKQIPGGHCGSLLGILIASGVWNTASDLVILLIPAVFVWQLKLSRKKRLAMVAVFAIGAIAPIFSVIGIGMREVFANSPDGVYGQWRILMFAYAEVTTGHICTSLPVLPRLYRWLRGQQQAGFLNATPQYRDGSAGRMYPDASAYGKSHTKHFLRKSGIQGREEMDILATQTYVELTEAPQSYSTGDKSVKRDDADYSLDVDGRRLSDGQHGIAVLMPPQSTAFGPYEERSTSVTAEGRRQRQQEPLRHTILRTTDIVISRDPGRSGEIASYVNDR